MLLVLILATWPFALVQGMVLQLDESFQVSVYTDKPTYRLGETVSVSVKVNHPASGILTITSPSGSVTNYNFGIERSFSTSLKAGMVGRWSVSVQANTSTAFASAIAYFDVATNVYDVSVLVVGLPSDVSIGLFVDGQYLGPIMTGSLRRLSFKVDTMHTISVTQSVRSSDGTLYFAIQNTWTVGSAGSHSFVYSIQGTSTTSTASSDLPDFTLRVSETAVTVAQMYGSQMTISGSYLNGFNSPVRLEILGLPEGATAGGIGYTYADASGFSQEWYIGTNCQTPPGTYYLSIVGRSQGLAHTQQIQLTVVASAYCSTGSYTTNSATSSIISSRTGDIVGSVDPGIRMVVLSSAIAFPILIALVVAALRLRPQTPHTRRPSRGPWSGISAMLGGGMLLVASLWQLEIVEISQSLNRDWCPPFMLFSCTPWYVARDLWFAGIVAAFVLALLGAWRYAGYSRRQPAVEVSSSVTRTLHASLDERLYTFIVGHGGTISRSAASRELNVPLAEIDASIERLKQAGRIA